jgi:hypothetical protein
MLNLRMSERPQERSRLEHGAIVAHRLCGFCFVPFVPLWLVRLDEIDTGP